MRVKIADIKVSDDRLRSPRAISDLAESMREIGQQQPIVLDTDFTLVCGWHRLEAAKFLQWQEIDAERKEFSTLAHRRLAEIDENLARYDLTALERIEHVAERVRILEELGMKRGPGRPRKNPLQHSGFSTSEIGGSLGLAGSTVRRNVQLWQSLPAPVRASLRGSRFEDSIKELIRVARMSPEEQYMLVVNLEHERAGARPQTGGVRELQRDMQRVQTRRLGLESPSPYGCYRTIVIDPPWAPEISGDVDPAGKIAPAYETWDLDRIQRLPLDDLAWEDDCWLFLWTTNAALPSALELIDAWGFTYQKKLVWIKERAVPARYFSGQHEDVIFATRGARLPARMLPDVFHGPPMQREHSSKPETFYELLDEVAPGPKLDMFARSQRDGWSSWGAEVPREARERLAEASDEGRASVG